MGQAPRRAAGLEWTVQDLETRDSLTSGEGMEGTAGLARNHKDQRCWRGFQPGSWCDTIDVRDFIVRNVTPYSGDKAFLAGPSKRTNAVWEKLRPPYFQDERKKGVLAVDARTPSTMLAHKAGYIDRENEVIVGLQTDQPFNERSFRSADCGWWKAGSRRRALNPIRWSTRRSPTTAGPTTTACSMPTPRRS